MIPIIHKGKLYASKYYKPEYGNALIVWESQLLEVDNVFEWDEPRPQLPIVFQLRAKWYFSTTYYPESRKELLMNKSSIEINPTTKGHCKIVKIKED